MMHLLLFFLAYSFVGLILMDIILTKELSKDIKNNFIQKYCKKLLPAEVLINTVVKIIKNIGEIFTVVLLELLNIVWKIISNIFDLVILCLGWPYLLWRVQKELKAFRLKNNIEE